MWVCGHVGCMVGAVSYLLCAMYCVVGVDMCVGVGVAIVSIYYSGPVFCVRNKYIIIIVTLTVQKYSMTKY